MATKTKSEINGRLTGVPTDADKPQELQVTPPKIEIVKFRLIGTAPLVQCRFPEKARNQIIHTQLAGSQAKKGKKRDPKDFEEGYEQARHKAVDGWDGIHAGGFRKAMIDACKLVGFFMTRAKLGIFIVADGYDKDGTPLVRITKGEPRKVIHPVRNASGVVDMRARPMWEPGWECVLTIRYDADMLSTTDILNLLARVGMQCGICEGRPNSKDSAGCDWGLFQVETA